MYSHFLCCRLTSVCLHSPPAGLRLPLWMCPHCLCCCLTSVHLRLPGTGLLLPQLRPRFPDAGLLLSLLLLHFPGAALLLPQLPPVIQEMTAAPVPNASVSSQTYSGNTTDSISTEHTPCAILRFLSGPRAGETASLPDGKTIIIGRNSKDSHIVIDDTSISRSHCSVQYQTVRRTFLITDCSSNGTYWPDGRKLPPHTTIEVPNGSVFYLGGRNTSFRLEA